MPIILDPLDVPSGPSIYAPKAPTDALVVGPHSILEHAGIIYNDRKALECYWVDDFQGFDTAELRVTDEDNPGEDGSTPNPGFFGPRIMSMTGEIKAGSYPALIAMKRVLLDSFLDLIEKPMLIRPAAGSLYFTHPEVQIDCRMADKPQIGNRITKEMESGHFVLPFTVALKATNPRYRSTVLHTASVAPTVVSTLGRVYDRFGDRVYNVTLNPQGDPTPAGNQLIVNNAGNYWSLPIIRFDGGMNTVILTNNENGQQIKLNNDLLAGDWVEIDIEKGEVTGPFGENRFNDFDTTSDWLRIEGARVTGDGNNVLALSVSTFQAGSLLTVSHRDQWM